MKYKVQAWGNPKRAGVNRITVTPEQINAEQLDEEQQLAIFPVGYSMMKEEQARMLATKVCAFLNELEEKKAQIAELMNIAGQ